MPGLMGGVLGVGVAYRGLRLLLAIGRPRLKTSSGKLPVVHIQREHWRAY